jgi:hypothetical protein
MDGAPSPSTRLLGLLGILGGLFLVAAFVPNLPWTSETFNLRLVLFNVGAIAIAIVMQRRVAAAARRVSTAVAISVILANAWYLLMVVLSVGRPQFPAPDPEFRLVFFYAGAAMWLTDAAFGLATWRLGKATAWGAAALVVGSVLAFLGMDRFELVRGELASLFVPLALAGIALNGAGWVLLGLDVAFRRRPRTPAPASGA